MKILAHFPGIQDATSWYRGALPLYTLRKLGHPVEIHAPQAFDWPTFAGGDILFLQRPQEKNAIALCQLARQMNVPIVVDFDDDLLNLPLEHPKAQVYREKSVQECIHQALAVADLTMVSTAALADSFQDKTKNIQVIPNAWDDYRQPLPLTYPDTKKTIFWRGSDTHAPDLEHFEDEIAEVAENFPDWDFHFVGYRPNRLMGRIGRDRAHHIPSTHTVHYFDTLKYLRAAVCMVPLVDNEFNRSKSNIAWIEAHTIGAVTVAPAFEAWRNAEFPYNPSRKGEFALALSAALQSRIREQLWTQSQTLIPRLSQVNPERLRAFQEVIR